MDDYRQRFYSTTDVPMGEVTNEMPVGTATLMVEQANVVPNGILLGCHFAKRKEFNLIKKRIYELFDTNQQQLSIKGRRLIIFKDDFNDEFDVLPTNDPQTNGFAQQLAKAGEVYKLANNPNTSLDFAKCEQLVLKSLRLPDYDTLVKQPSPPPPPSPMENMAMQDGMLDLQAKSQQNKYDQLKNQLDLVAKAKKVEQDDQQHKQNMKQQQLNMFQQIGEMGA